MQGRVAGSVVAGVRPGPVQFLDVISWPRTGNKDWCGEWQEDEQE